MSGLGNRIRKVSVNKIILNFTIWILLFLLLYPLMMTFWCAFKNDLIFDSSKWYPTFPFRISNLATAFNSIWRYILNTIIVAATGTICMLFIASLSSYTFARMEFVGKEVLFMSVVALMMIPGVLTLVPAYMIYKSFGFLDSYAALILPIVTGGPIFGIFLLRHFFSSIPKDVFESAQIDGAGHFRIYYSIAVPLCIPILGTLTIMQIVGVWNDLLWPMITIKDQNLLTISAGLLIRFTGQYSQNMPVTFAGYLVSSVPLILLFAYANKYYVEGLVNTAIKM